MRSLEALLRKGAVMKSLGSLMAGQSWLGKIAAVLAVVFCHVPGAWGFAITFVSPGYLASNFATVGINTNAIAFDGSLNLYVEDQSTGGTTFDILKLSAP